MPLGVYAGAKEYNDSDRSLAIRKFFQPLAVSIIMNQFVLILPLLLGAEPAASRITLPESPRSLTDLAAELGRQANVRIEIDSAAKSLPISLKCDGTPFWDALEQLARKSNQRLIVAPQGPRVTLGGGP